MRCIVCNTPQKLSEANLFDDRYGAPGLYSIYECQKCGFGRTHPVLSKKEIGEFYRKYYPLSKYNSNVIKSNANIPNKLLAYLFGIDNTTHWRVKQNSNVMDIGSGSGQSLLEIQKMGSTAYGVEPDPSAQKIAKKLKLKVFKGFLSDNPFPKIKFDFITGSQVIEHEPDPLKFLKIAKNKLNSKGKIILSFPNYDSLYRKIFGRKWLNWHVPYHINFFNEKSFSKLAKDSDLKIVKIRTITPNVWTLMQLRSLFSSTQIGNPNPIWTKPTSAGFVLKSSFNLKGVIYKFLTILFLILITPINRLIDIVGIGDSILVTLEK